MAQDNACVQVTSLVTRMENSIWFQPRYCFCTVVQRQTKRPIFYPDNLMSYTGNPHLHFHTFLRERSDNEVFPIDYNCHD